MKVTLFECWNGGRVFWDRINYPQFVFGFPAQSPEVITFFQLSGRVCEVLTNSEWLLNMAGQIYDIPNLPTQEINTFIKNVERTMGYISVQVPSQIGDVLTGYVTINLALWANAKTGRADMYSPSTGLIVGQQLLSPQAQVGTSNSCYDIDVTSQGNIQGSGVQNLMRSFTEMTDNSGDIGEFFSNELPSDYYQSYDSSNDQSYNYDTQSQFEQDSAGWPGGAYQNPDSNYYEPDRYD